MKSRRLIASPEAYEHCSNKHELPTDVCFGSKADMARSNCDVRFTPESRHREALLECLLWAKTGHRARYSIASSARGRVLPGKILAVASSGPNAGPKAEGNRRSDHERDHNCVP
jgi:hypothetical protein